MEIPGPPPAQRRLHGPRANATSRSDPWRSPASISASTSSAGTTADDYVYKPKKGLNEDVVRDISHHKDEPEWMTKFRLNALKRFERKPMLEWFAKNMPDIDFDDIYYYLKPTEDQVSEWAELPEEMQATYEKLGIPEAERKFLAGRDRAVRERGRLPPQPRRPRGDGRPLHEHGHRAARLPRDRARALRDGHPAG